jgi:valine dehydrogenase (NAD+)
MTRPAGRRHLEQVVLATDDASGMRAIVAIHSTALGPALGGTRCYPYPDDAAALADVTALARAMSYKNALAGIPHGGGKGVLILDPATGKTRERLLAYGRLVASLQGRYVTACDVGTTVQDMDVIAQACPYTTGGSPGRGGAGDSGVLTAVGVFLGMRACAELLWGEPTLRGRRVGIAGVGKVGRRLARLLVDDGAQVVVADVAAAAVERTRDEVPEVSVTDPASLPELDLDVYSPCAMGSALGGGVAERLSARLVCGGANNQLPEAATGDLLAARGILYAPDFLVNAGGVIAVADELDGFDRERARARVALIYDTTRAVLDAAQRDAVTPVAAAEALAEARIESGYAAAGWVPYPTFPR